MTSWGRLRERGFSKLRVNPNEYVLGMVVFFACFAMTFACGSLSFVVRVSRAVSGLGLAPSSPTVSLYVTPELVSMDIAPTPAGALSSTMQHVSVATASPAGYSLFLEQTDGFTPGMPEPGSSSILRPIDGTLAEPVTLPNGTWGYAISGVDSVNVVANGFDDEYGVPNPSAGSLWADPSVLTLIKKTGEVTPESGDKTTVYYGARAHMAIASGTHTFSILYSATADPSSVPVPTVLSVIEKTGSTAGGTPVEIVGTGFTVNDASVTTAVLIGEQACENISISSNVPVVGQDTIYCDSPEHPEAGAVAVTVETWGGVAAVEMGFLYEAPRIMSAAFSGPVPGVNNIFPAGTTGTTLTVVTDIPAICYIGSAQNPTVTMATTGVDGAGVTTHVQAITGLTNQSTGTRYIRCQAGDGHSFSSPTAGYELMFYVRAATPAAPTLSPANGATVTPGSTTITVTRSGATCTWGTSSGSYPNSSGSSRNVVVGTNTLYYRCIVGSGNTASEARTGSWSFTGRPATPTSMQTMTPEYCTYMSRGDTITLRDTRNSQNYRVRKMPDDKCWMIDNLKYVPTGSSPRYQETTGEWDFMTANPSSGTESASNWDVARWGDPERIDNAYCDDGNDSYYYEDDLSQSTTRCGYLYNWYGTTYGTGGAEFSSGNATGSICPNNSNPGNVNSTPWRLPTGNFGRTDASTLGDFGVLDQAMGGTGRYEDQVSLSYTDYAWNHNGLFQGIFAGTWYNGHGFDAQRMAYWTSSVNATDPSDAKSFVLYRSSYDEDYARELLPGTEDHLKRSGLAVRCLIAP